MIFPRFYLALTLLSPILLHGAVSTQTTDRPKIRIAHINSMTGSEAMFGQGAERGILLAIDEINAKGGLLGKKVEVVTLDDQGKSDEAVTAMTKVITEGGYVGVVSEMASGRSIAMAPLAQSAKLPMVSPSATDPKFTKVGDYIFRVCFIDPYQGPVIAKFALEKLKKPGQATLSAAVLVDVRNDYSVSLAKYFKSAFLQSGGKIVHEDKYSSGDVDFRTQLTAIREKKPDVIFIPGYYTEVGLIARQARELKLNQPLLGGDGWDSPALMEIGKDAINGSFFANHYSPDDKSQRVQDFIRKYRDRYKQEPDSNGALGYDAAGVLIQAVKAAGSTDRALIRDALAKTKDFPGVTGNISIDAERNAIKPAVILQVVNGKLHFHSSVNL